MAGTIKCKCGKTFATGRGLAAHKRFHCKGAAAASSASECDCKDGGDWHVLTRAVDPQHYGQVNPDTGKRYHKYCETCREVV